MEWLGLCREGHQSCYVTQQVLGKLSVHELEDFDAIKAALERRFDPAEKENLHRVEFRSRFKKKGESVTEYGFALNRIASDNNNNNVHLSCAHQCPEHNLGCPQRLGR